MTALITRDLKVALSTSQQEILKWAAVITMAIDHVDKVALGGSAPQLSAVGRVSFPLFAFLLAYNLEVRGVKAGKYVAPLTLFGVLSQPVYAWAFGRAELNILFTLLLGVAYSPTADFLAQQLRLGRLKHVMGVMLFITPALFVSYAIWGVFLVPLFRHFLRRPGPLTLMLIVLDIILANNLQPNAWFAPLAVMVIYAVTRSAWSIPRSSRWVFYVFYPAHLILIKAASLS